MIPIKRTCGLAAAFVLFSLSGTYAGAGNYYRWVDETGTTVNSDRPPPTGVDYEVISSSTNLMYTETDEDDSAPVEEPPAVARTTDVKRSAARPMLEKNPEYCDQATRNLEMLNTRARIRVPDGNGNYRYINDDEKAQQRETAEAIVAQHCE